MRALMACTWGMSASYRACPAGVRLTRALRRSCASTSRTLTALLGKGLIERVVLAHDRRSARVSLTPAGQALYDALMPQVQAINARILQVLDPAQKQALDQALEGLRVQAQHLLDEMGAELPKADRRRGARARQLPLPRSDRRSDA